MYLMYFLQGLPSKQDTNVDSTSSVGAIIGSVLGFLFIFVLVVCVIIVKNRRVGQLKRYQHFKNNTVYSDAKDRLELAIRRRKDDKSSNASNNTNIVTKYEPNYCEPWNIKSKNNNDNVQDRKPITFIDDGIFSSKYKTTSPSNGNDYSTIELDFYHLEKVEYETDTNDNTEDNVYSHLREVNVESDKYDHLVRQSSSIRRNIDGNYSFTFRNRSNDGYDMCNLSLSLKKDNEDDLNY